MLFEKMVTVNASHISLITADLLRDAAERPERQFPLVYSKGESGWIVSVPKNFISVRKGRVVRLYPQLPHDLEKLMDLAFGACCRWLCLEKDGQTVKDLKTYTW